VSEGYWTRRAREQDEMARKAETSEEARYRRDTWQLLELQEALTAEREAHAATLAELERLRAFLQTAPTQPPPSAEEAKSPDQQTWERAADYWKSNYNGAVMRLGTAWTRMELAERQLAAFRDATGCMTADDFQRLRTSIAPSEPTPPPQNGRVERGPLEPIREQLARIEATLRTLGEAK
jgi:hypothetical protein